MKAQYGFGFLFLRHKLPNMLPKPSSSMNRLQDCWYWYKLRWLYLDLDIYLLCRNYR